MTTLPLPLDTPDPRPEPPEQWSQSSWDGTLPDRPAPALSPYGDLPSDGDIQSGKVVRRALITGITGQDGSYLAEQLVARGYFVYGLVRRTSHPNYENLRGILTNPDPFVRGRLTLIAGDVTDPASVSGAMCAVLPHEVYNLAAMSFVGASWAQARLTFDVNAIGFLNILEAAKAQMERARRQDYLSLTAIIPDPRVYQASTSEMFGKTAPPQNEDSRLSPRSPYGIAKLAAHMLARVYRESYGLYVASGILFNHECISAKTPLLIRQGGTIRAVTPYDLVPIKDKSKGKAKQTWALADTQIWDGDQWADLRHITATALRTEDASHRMLEVNARGGTVDVTASHNMLDAEGNKMPAGAIRHGTPMPRLLLATHWPTPSGWARVSDELAAFLGYMVADGYIERDGNKIQYTKNARSMRGEVADLWHRLFGGTSREWEGKSGFSTGGPVTQLALTGVPAVAAWLREMLYSGDLKQVPPLILNATASARRAFLDAYYAGDGLKAGNGLSFKTNSPVLALGLIYLYGLEGNRASVYVEHREGKRYYAVNLRSNDAIGEKGQHLAKDPAEVMSIGDGEPTNWVFDLETSTGKFMAGVGRIVVANSPRRGLEFVTRKIARAIARIQAGRERTVELGDTSAQRDWGYAPEYTEAMRLILRHRLPEDFVIGTGQTHSVREFTIAAFSEVGCRDPWPYVMTRGTLMRPAEIPVLRADCQKAKRLLGWSPHILMPDLAALMVRAEMDALNAQPLDPLRVELTESKNLPPIQ